MMELQWSEYADDIAPATVVVVGFVLFVFPEPATTALGSGLLLFGAAWWFYEWRRPRRATGSLGVNPCR
jgi:hypothetical protein